MPWKLLVADDSATIQTVISLAFADENVEIEAVSTGDLVFEKARSTKPDVILADVFMPGCSGYEVCERIKADPELCHIPVVLMVGTFELFDRSEAERVGFDGYLTKPFDTNELIHKVRSLAGAKRVEPTPATTLQEDSAAVTSAGVITPEPLISERTRESFLGSNAILDLYGSQDDPPPGRIAARSASKGGELPQEVLRTIIEGVVRRLSPDIVREVAWEVIPELAEMMVRQRLSQGVPPAGVESKPNP